MSRGDLVTDGERTFRLPGGSAMMTKITGAGCSLGGVTATYLAVAEPLVAALAASLLYDRASEIAEVNPMAPVRSRWRCSTRCGTSPPIRWPASDIIEPTDRNVPWMVSHHRIVYTEYIRSVRCDGK